MSKKILHSANTFDLSQVPMYFADQPSSLMLGAAVSKLTFGVSEEDDGDFPRPVVTIAIPTSALIQLVHDLKKTFDSPKFRKETSELLLEGAKVIAAGGKPTPLEEVLVIESPRRQVKRPITAK